MQHNFIFVSLLKNLPSHQLIRSQSYSNPSLLQRFTKSTYVEIPAKATAAKIERTSTAKRVTIK